MIVEKTLSTLTEHQSILLAKQEWEQIFDAVSDLIFIVDKNNIIVRANRAMATRCGLSPKELVGRKYYDVVHGVNCSAVDSLYVNSEDSRSLHIAELELASLQGTFEITFSPLFNDQGERSASVYIARDITEKRRVAQAFQESEKRFSLFMEYLPLAVFIKDQCGRILYANQYLKELFITSEKLHGLTADELLPDETARKMAMDDKEALTQGLGLYRDVLIDTYGQEIIFDTYKFPIPSVDGTTLLGGISVDVTEKKRHEELLAAQQQKLKEVNATLEARISAAVTELRQKDALLIQESRLSAMGEMISSLAHQWRQPLNNIGLIVQGLQLSFKANVLTAEELDADIVDAMNVLQQISGTIDNFRNFFTTEKEQSTFFVNEVINSALVLVGRSLNNDGIRIAVEERPYVTAEGYPNEYAQAFLNIILNARDALREQQVQEPLITITVFEENGRSIVTIRDNGGGIKDDILPKIFDPFFTTKQQDSRAGIGLYMSKMIIEKHMKGLLTVHCDNGFTEFRIEV